MLSEKNIFLCVMYTTGIAENVHSLFSKNMLQICRIFTEKDTLCESNFSIVGTFVWFVGRKSLQ